VNRTKVVKLYIYLREHGVRVEIDRRKARMAAALVQVVQEEEPSDWATIDIERFKKDNLTVLSKQLEARIKGVHIRARAVTQRVGSVASVSGSRIRSRVGSQVGTPQLQPQELNRRL
jgi:hypothetical protein